MTTKQDTDMNRNPTGKGGFGDNPQHRHNGAWKKESTPRYKLEKMMELSQDELYEVFNDTQAPLFERKLASSIAKGDWKTIREMIAEVYGTPRQSLDVTTGGEQLKPTIVEFIEKKV